MGAATPIQGRRVAVEDVNALAVAFQTALNNIQSAERLLTIAREDMAKAFNAFGGKLTELSDTCPTTPTGQRPRKGVPA